MFLNSILCAALFPLLLFVVAQNTDEPCTLRHERKIYDLRSFQGSKDYEFTTPGKQNVTLNVCKPVASEGWNLKDVNKDRVGGFVRKDRMDFCLGESNSTITLAPDSTESKTVLQIAMTQGSRCGEDGIRASSLIRFVCSDSTDTQPQLIAQLPPGNEEACAWVFEWKTKAACGSSIGGIGSFFLTLFSTFIVLACFYLILGTLYNRYVLKLTGMAQIPRFSFESAKYHCTEFLFLLMDWYEKLTGRPTRNQLPRTNPVSHQSQFTPQSTQEPDDGFGFVRPSRKPSSGKTNPVSHQSAVLAAKTRARDSGTAEEREFMLGDDEDDDNDDGPPPISGPPPPPRTISGAPTTRREITPPEIAPPPTTESSKDASADIAQLRGRVTEEGDITRL